MLLRFARGFDGGGGANDQEVGSGDFEGEFSRRAEAEAHSLRRRARSTEESEEQPREL